jgi:hypothetical protein
MQCRIGEAVTSSFRAPRFFCISGQWYFSSRENLKVGPFPTLVDAEMELLVFLRHVDEGGIYANGYPHRSGLSPQAYNF